MSGALDVQLCDRLLTTTRSLRKRLDLTKDVPTEIIEECLDIAVQSPTGTNTQKWHFVVVRNSDKRKQVAEIYKKAFELYWADIKKAERNTQTQPLSTENKRMFESARYLADHLGKVPVLLIFCLEEDMRDMSPFHQATAYGSVLPAAWSFMLAARARGLGSCWTTLHLKYAFDVSSLLGIPDTVTQCVLLPVAYSTVAELKVAKRSPAKDVTHWDCWNGQK